MSLTEEEVKEIDTILSAIQIAPPEVKMALMAIDRTFPNCSMVLKYEISVCYHHIAKLAEALNKAHPAHNNASDCEVCKIANTWRDPQKQDPSEIANVN